MITLKTLNQVSKQEVFDQVVKHLLSQNKRSELDESCRYRYGDLKCAAGCLIADDEYDKNWEGQTWRSLVRDGYVPSNFKDMIEDLQQIHDELSPEEWREHLKSLAEIYKLEWNH